MFFLLVLGPELSSLLKLIGLVSVKPLQRKVITYNLPGLNLAPHGYMAAN